MRVWPSWSCDLDHLYKRSFFPSSQGYSTYDLALIGRTVLEKKIFENGGHIQVNSPWAGADNPLGSNLALNVSIQSI